MLVARSGKLTCPVAMLERYMAMGGLSSSSGILFLPLSRGGEQLRPTRKLSHTRLRELLLHRLESLDYSKPDFGDHSLQSGGATAAAQAGVPDRGMVVGNQIVPRMAMLKTHGYVKDSISSLKKPRHLSNPLFVTLECVYMHGKYLCLVHGQANPRVCVLYMQFSLAGSGILLVM